MFYLIYKTTNILNGKYYIGKHQTKDKEDGYLGSGKLLKVDIKKYGKENFHREILHECSSEKEMNNLEKILVVPDLETNYNLCPGGYGGGLNRETALAGVRKQNWLRANDPVWKENNRKARAISTTKSNKTKWENPDYRKKMIPILKSSTAEKNIGEKNHMYGKKMSWINNGTITKRIESHMPLPEGWQYGTLIAGYKIAKKSPDRSRIL